jgi:hypothetical protein
MDRVLHPVPPESISGFQTADEFDSIPRTREEELEDKVRQLEREKEEREDTQEISVKVKPARQVITSDEKLAFITNIHDLKLKTRDLENTLSDQNEQLSDLNERCSGLGKLLQETTKRVSALEDKRDNQAFSELKRELHDILADKYSDCGINGVYVRDLYNKTRKRRMIIGKLNISKSTASRLKIAIQSDPESPFRIDKNNQKEVVRLKNIK